MVEREMPRVEEIHIEASRAKGSPTPKEEERGTGKHPATAVASIAVEASSPVIAQKRAKVKEDEKKKETMKERE